MSLATTRASFYRGVAVDALGDEVDDNTVPLLGLNDVPVGLIEYGTRIQDPNTGMWQTVRMARGRLRSGLGILAGDRLKDNRTGNFYLVDDVRENARSIAGQSSTRLTLSILAGTVADPGTPDPVDPGTGPIDGGSPGSDYDDDDLLDGGAP